MTPLKHQFVLLGSAALLGFALAAGPALADLKDHSPPSPHPSVHKKGAEKKNPSAEQKKNRQTQSFEDYKAAHA